MFWVIILGSKLKGAYNIESNLCIPTNKLFVGVRHSSCVIVIEIHLLICKCGSHIQI